MKSVSCSMYILVFFEYSNSMWASRRRCLWYGVPLAP